MNLKNKFELGDIYIIYLHINKLLHAALENYI